MTELVDMPTLTTYYANGADPLRVEFSAQMPSYDVRMSEFEYERQNEKFFAIESQRIVAVLWEHLPGGLVDALFAEFCRRKASILHVPHKEPSTAYSMRQETP